VKYYFERREEAIARQKGNGLFYSMTQSTACMAQPLMPLTIPN